MAVNDKAEKIKLRLKALLDTLVGTADGQFRTSWRNRAAVDPYSSDDPNDTDRVAQLPCVILLDGKEVPKLRTTGHNVNGRAPATTMTLLPQVFIILMPRENGTNEGVGEELSAFRIKILDKLFNDQSLIALMGDNGELEYQGYDTDLQTGSAIEGQMRLDVALSYTFNPDHLR
jgi:hypothetical protein